jgi:hypothetical protein
MSDEHDDDLTNPEILGLGTEEPTKPGIGGSGEGYISFSRQARRALDAIEKLENSCPYPGEPGFDRHVEVLAHAWGDVGMLCFDTRRITLEWQRERKKP